eukprot:NODE_169_length_16247_cov_0.185348.p10 type:complete len:208 gc:universal NODE_169_length_16247_cov_0.185348:4831-4208(-)
MDFAGIFLCIILILLSVYYLILVRKLGHANEVNGFLAGAYIAFVALHRFHMIIVFPSCVVSGALLLYLSKTYAVIQPYITALLGSSSLSLWFLSWNHPCLFKSLLARLGFFVIIYLLFMLALRNVKIVFSYVCHSLVGSYLFILGADFIYNVGIIDKFLVILTDKKHMDYSSSTYIPLLMYVFLFLFAFYSYCVRDQAKRLSIMIQV